MLWRPPIDGRPLRAKPMDWRAFLDLPMLNRTPFPSMDLREGARLYLLALFALPSSARPFLLKLITPSVRRRWVDMVARGCVTVETGAKET